MSGVLFDPEPGRDYTPEGATDGTPALHSHTEPTCVFCDKLAAMTWGEQ
jgi:hypothetical protein